MKVFADLRVQLKASTWLDQTQKMRVQSKLVGPDQDWAAGKLDWRVSNFDLTIFCRNKEQVLCHKALMAAASPFVASLLEEVPDVPNPVLVLDDVEVVHLRRW